MPWFKNPFATATAKTTNASPNSTALRNEGRVTVTDGASLANLLGADPSKVGDTKKEEEFAEAYESEDDDTFVDANEAEEDKKRGQLPRDPSIENGFEKLEEDTIPDDDFEKMGEPQRIDKVTQPIEQPKIYENYWRWASWLNNQTNYIYKIYPNLGIKGAINYLYTTHRPGQAIKSIMSFGVTFTTATSILYHPYLFLTCASYLTYLYIGDQQTPETNFKRTRIAGGLSALLFNYISPIIFDPAESTFLFTTYLYFTFFAYGALTSTDIKTQMLSRISYFTGVNAFMLNDPLVYVGALTLISGGYLDDVVNNVIQKQNYVTQIFANASGIFEIVKKSSADARDIYLASIGDVLVGNIKTVIHIPEKIMTYIKDKFSGINGGADKLVR